MADFPCNTPLTLVTKVSKLFHVIHGKAVMKRIKRDIQGKFTLKNSDYREVRSLRLTDDTWKRLGIVSECLGLTRADYLEEIVAREPSPCNTRKSQDSLQFFTSSESECQPSITREQELANATQLVGLPVAELEILRDRVLSQLKLGKQASGYKTAQKALNRFIAELIGSV